MINVEIFAKFMEFWSELRTAICADFLRPAKNVEPIGQFDEYSWSARFLKFIATQKSSQSIYKHV